MSDDKKIEFTTEFTSDEKKIIIDWHRSTVTNKNCTQCASTLGWSILPTPTTKVLFDRKEDRHVSTKVAMFVTFVCRNCGHSNDFYAETIGFGTKHGPEKHDLARAKGETKS